MLYALSIYIHTYSVYVDQKTQKHPLAIYIYRHHKAENFTLKKQTLYKPANIHIRIYSNMYRITI